MRNKHEDKDINSLFISKRDGSTGQTRGSLDPGVVHSAVTSKNLYMNLLLTHTLPQYRCSSKVSVSFQHRTQHEH